MTKNTFLTFLTILLVSINAQATNLLLDKKSRGVPSTYQIVDSVKMIQSHTLAVNIQEVTEKHEIQVTFKGFGYADTRKLQDDINLGNIDSISCADTLNEIIERAKLDIPVFGKEVKYCNNNGINFK